MPVCPIWLRARQRRQHSGIQLCQARRRPSPMPQYLASLQRSATRILPRRMMEVDLPAARTKSASCQSCSVGRIDRHGAVALCAVSPEPAGHIRRPPDDRAQLRYRHSDILVSRAQQGAILFEQAAVAICADQRIRQCLGPGRDGGRDRQGQCQNRGENFLCRQACQWTLPLGPAAAPLTGQMLRDARNRAAQERPR